VRGRNRELRSRKRGRTLGRPLKRGGIATFQIIAISVFILFALQGTAASSDPFGPPQPVSRETGGLHTGIGYWHHSENYENGRDHKVNQNQVYSELGYGARNWGVVGRIGLADVKISDVFRSAEASTATSRDDFADRWNFYGTLGAKGFYPFNSSFGIGAFVQGSYYFGDFTDTVSGTRFGAPFTAELKVKDLWDVNFGLGFQATVPKGIKLYLGPYLRYSEARMSLSPNVPGLQSAAEDVKNSTIWGGFAGADVPLGRGFRLGVEGQYSERLSIGAAVTYSY
jgi:hypothetical protein